MSGFAENSSLAKTERAMSGQTSDMRSIAAVQRNVR
jgi:hypothetical protein